MASGSQTCRPTGWRLISATERSGVTGRMVARSSSVYLNARDHVRTSMRGYMLDMLELVNKLASVPFETASFRQIRWWDNPAGPAYKAPEGTIGTAALGFSV